MFCKICGSKIEDESFFCPVCGAHIKSPQDDASEISKMKQVVKREEAQSSMTPSPSKPLPMFTCRHSQAVNYFPLLFGLMVLTFALAMIFPSVTHYIIPSGFMVIALAVLSRHYQYHLPQGYENRLMYFAVACVVLTFGVAMIFSSDSHYIIPVGGMLAALILTGHFARQSHHNRVVYGIISVSILTLGSAMIFPSVAHYIFPAGGIIIALILIAWALHRSSPRQLYDNSHSFRP